VSKRQYDKGRRPQFLRMYVYVIRSDAWKATSLGARALFMGLKAYYSSNFENNGHVFLSKRRAADECGLDHSSVSRWYRELQHYGFIKQTQGSHLGLGGKGKAAKWRLTDEPYKGEPPTNDFLRWDGVLFEPNHELQPPHTTFFSRTEKPSTLDGRTVHPWTEEPSIGISESGRKNRPYLGLPSGGRLGAGGTNVAGKRGVRHPHERARPTVRPKDDSQRLRRLRRDAVDAAKEAYIFGDANSFTHEAMRSVMALDKELNNFRLVPKRYQREMEADEESPGASARERTA
jgi:hypothetical protein